MIAGERARPRRRGRTVACMAALLEIVRFLIPVIGLLAGFAAVMAAVFMVVPWAIERLAARSDGWTRMGLERTRR